MNLNEYYVYPKLFLATLRTHAALHKHVCTTISVKVDSEETERVGKRVLLIQYSNTSVCLTKTDDFVIWEQGKPNKTWTVKADNLNIFGDLGLASFFTSNPRNTAGLLMQGGKGCATYTARLRRYVDVGIINNGHIKALLEREAKAMATELNNKLRWVNNHAETMKSNFT